MAVRVEFTAEAIADIESIGDYIDHDSPDVAVALIERLRQRCLSLASFPKRSRRYGGRYRTLIEGDYLIFYRSDGKDAVETVVIALVVHGARDYADLLSGR